MMSHRLWVFLLAGAHLVVSSADVSGSNFLPISSISASDDSDASALIQGPGVGFVVEEPHEALATNAEWVTTAEGVSDYFSFLSPRPSPKLLLDLGEDVMLTEISTWALSETATSARDFLLCKRRGNSGRVGGVNPVRFGVDWFEV
jgi:hypothetical protein